MFVFKLLVYVLGINDLYLLNRYGLPADNLDFQNYLFRLIKSVLFQYY